MNKLLAYVSTAVIALFVFAPAVATLTPAPYVGAQPAKNCNARMLGMPPWYRGITKGADCDLDTPSGDADAVSGFIWKIVLNVIEIVLVIIVYISVGFTLYGGFLFMTGGSNPSTIEKARKTITNAIIGLIIGMMAIGIVNFIFGVI